MQDEWNNKSDFTSWLKQQKGHKASKGQRPLRDGKEMRQALQLPRFTVLREFPGHQSRRKSLGGACRLHQLMRWNWESEKNLPDRAPEKIEQPRKKNSGNMQRVTLVYSAEYWLAYVYVRKVPKPRGKPFKWLKGSVLGNPKSRETAQLLSSQRENLTIHGELRSILSRVLPQ